NEEEGEHDDEEEDEQGDEEVLWQDVPVGEDEMNDGDVDGDEEADDAIPIMGADVEEEGDMSDADEYDKLGVLDVTNAGGATFGIFASASRGRESFILDAFGGGNPPEVDQLFWHELSRPSRRRKESVGGLVIPWQSFATLAKFIIGAGHAATSIRGLSTYTSVAFSAFDVVWTKVVQSRMMGDSPSLPHSFYESADTPILDV
ncbi:hypothetical protein K474DRAFT_1680792, partial [Panus rudis PR-1116 ss-1]